jgi:hypothetical protein
MPALTVLSLFTEIFLAIAMFGPKTTSTSLKVQPDEDQGPVFIQYPDGTVEEAEKTAAESGLIYAQVAPGMVCASSPSASKGPGWPKLSYKPVADKNGRFDC